MSYEMFHTYISPEVLAFLVLSSPAASQARFLVASTPVAAILAFLRTLVKTSVPRLEVS